MKSRGLAMGVTAAAVVQKAAVASPIAIQAAGRIFAEPARNKKQTMRYVLPSKPDVPAHRSGSVASMRTTRTNLKPVGVRVGPSRRAIEDDTLDFLTVAASTAKALELNDSGYALSKQTTLELARSIVVFKVLAPSDHVSRVPRPEHWAAGRPFHLARPLQLRRVRNPRPPGLPRADRPRPSCSSARSRSW